MSVKEEIIKKVIIMEMFFGKVFLTIVNEKNVADYKKD